MKPVLVVMAAGMGSRYGGIKQIEPVGLHGEAVMEYTLFDARRAGFGEGVFIVRREIEKEVMEFLAPRLGGFPARFVRQELGDLPGGRTPPPGRTKPWGTAHAILRCRGLVDRPFAVVNADDFYGRDAFRVMASRLRNMDPSGTDFAMVGYRLKNTLSESGSVSRGICVAGEDGFLRSIEEHTRIERTPGGIVSRREGGDVPLSGDELTSMNLFGFTPGIFPFLEREFISFFAERGGDPAAECYIPSVVGALVSSGEARVEVLPSSAEWFGITYPADRPAVQRGIRRLIDRGVYPPRLA